MNWWTGAAVFVSVGVTFFLTLWWVAKKVGL